jgi:hypothetical protein
MLADCTACEVQVLGDVYTNDAVEVTVQNDQGDMDLQHCM